MKFEIDRAKAQFDFEHEHRLRILQSSKGISRKRAFIDAYSGLSAGIQSGRFLNEESEPAKKAMQK